VVELLTCTGVDGWEHPISVNVLRRGTPLSLVLSNNALHSASAADERTLCIMVYLLSMGPLLGSGWMDGLSPM
jgi:hypothetical protein